MTITEGTRLGSCRIIRLLSSGAVGDVYLGQQDDLGRQVAVKVLRDYGGDTPLAEQPQMVARFTQEARAIAALEHPNILPIYQFGEQDGIYYLVMQYVPDGSMADLMTTRSPQPLFHLPCSPLVALAIVSAAGAALQYAHDRHVMHLDVKPHNLLIKVLGAEESSGGQAAPFHVFLSDFGLAHLMTLQSFQSGMTGTPLYTAPEQYQRHPVPASDQYALACVAYQLLVGVPPFQGGLAELMHQHMQVTPPFITSRNPSLPPQLNAVFATALAKDPTQRYPSVAAFVKALQGVFGATSAGSSPSPFAPGGVPNFASTSASGLGLSGAGEVSPNRVTLSGIPVVAVQSTASMGVVNDEPRNPLPRRPNPVGKWLAELPRPLSIGGGIGLLLIVALSGLLVSHATMKTPKRTPPLFTVNYQRPIQGAPNARPVINGNVIYEAAHDGTLYALDLDSGREVWHFTTGSTLVAGVAVDPNGMLYLPAGDGNLYALNPDGTLKWKYALGSAAVTTPVVVGNVVGIGSADGHYSGLSIDKGKLLWQVSATASFANESALDKNILYIGNANHRFYAINMTNGQTVWSFKADGPIKGGTIYKDKTVIFGTESATLYCLGGDRGQLIWRDANVGTIDTQPLVNGGSVYIASKDGNLYSFDATTGGLIWQKSLGGSLSIDALLVNNTIIIIADDGTLTEIDPTTPAIVGRQQLGQTLSAPLALSTTTVYVSGNGYFERVTLTSVA